MLYLGKYSTFNTIRPLILTLWNIEEAACGARLAAILALITDIFLLWVVLELEASQAHIAHIAVEVNWLLIPICHLEVGPGWRFWRLETLNPVAGVKDVGGCPVAVPLAGHAVDGVVVSILVKEFSCRSTVVS